MVRYLEVQETLDITKAKLDDEVRVNCNTNIYSTFSLWCLFVLPIALTLFRQLRGCCWKINLRKLRRSTPPSWRSWLPRYGGGGDNRGVGGGKGGREREKLMRGSSNYPNWSRPLLEMTFLDWGVREHYQGPEDWSQGGGMMRPYW